MMQELFTLSGDNKHISINGASLYPPSQSLSSPSPSGPSPSPSLTATPTNTNSTTTNPPEKENLRCPRCDSLNTKFCYYNNYNLTQPRHFCKTCRRYWTKGGALRNIPIGGGCRKNRPCSNGTSISTSPMAAKSSTTYSKMIKASMANDFERFDINHHHELTSSPILWHVPQNSHLLSLLATTPNPNPNHNFVKAENHMLMSSTSNHLNGQTLSLDSLNDAVPCLGMGNNYWKNIQQNGIIVGNCNEAQNVGLQEIYQRLRSSTSGNYYGGSSQSPAMPSISEETLAGASGTDFVGRWNPGFSWSSDFPTTNGTAYP